MNSLQITYHFQFPETRDRKLAIELDRTSLNLLAPRADTLPTWTELAFQQCPHCPLDVASNPHCPLAASLVPVVNEFNEILSYENLMLTVVTAERTVSQHTTAQRALGSFMGLLIACSGCPYTGFFKPMARYHLPLASEAETVYRSISTYLLAQYFLHQEGKPFDITLKGLEELYAKIKIVNLSVVRRLRKASKADSHVNAIIILDLYALAVPSVIEDSLLEIRHLFTPYLQDQASQPPG